MPTAKPTQVIVHRIELQKTEREILEGAAVAQSAGALLSGIGNLLDPFSKPIAVIFAAWIAKEGIEDVWNWIDGKINEKDRKLGLDYVRYLDAYNAAVAAGADPGAGPMTAEEYAKKFDKDYATNWDNVLAWLSPSSTGDVPTGDGGFTPPGR